MNHNSGATKGMPCYSASITREQFLFKENRIVAALILEGKTFDEILEQCTDENLFQLPTQKSIRSIALACYKRLTFPDSKELIELIAKGYANDARLALLYAFTCQNLIVRDFMVDVIGPKYKSGDYSFDKTEAARFLFELGQRIDSVGKCTDQTLKKVRSVLVKCLAEAGYLTTVRSNELVQICPCDELQTIIQNRGDSDILPAFNVLN